MRYNHADPTAIQAIGAIDRELRIQRCRQERLAQAARAAEAARSRAKAQSEAHARRVRLARYRAAHPTVWVQVWTDKQGSLFPADNS